MFIVQPHSVCQFNVFISDIDRERVSHLKCTVCFFPQCQLVIEDVMDEDNEALVSLLQSANTSSAHGMDTEVMDFLPSESEHGHVGPIYGPHLPGLEAGNSVENGEMFHFSVEYC